VAVVEKSCRVVNVAVGDRLRATPSLRSAAPEKTSKRPLVEGEIRVIDYEDEDNKPVWPTLEFRIASSPGHISVTPESS